MNYYGGKELAESFRTVRKNTVAVAQDIPQEHYGFRAAPETRSVSEILAHIATSPRFPLRVHKDERRKTFAGIDFPALIAEFQTEERKPRTKDQVIELLITNGETYAKWLEELPDDFLGEVVEMAPGAVPASKTRFDLLLGTKEHEMHHRAQLMLIERMLGIVPHLTRRLQERMNAAATAKK